MPRRTYLAPNGENSVLDRWRLDGRVRAIGLLTVKGGFMNGRELARSLGMSPRGLRQFLVKDDLIKVEIHRGSKPRGEPWYRINMAALPPPPEPPKYLGDPRKVTRLPRLGGPTALRRKGNWAPVALTHRLERISA